MSVVAYRKSSSLADLSKSSANGKEKPGDVNMNEMVSENGDISLTVVLPDREVREMSVKYNMPMMDLLVHVASSNRLKPGEHVISVISEETGRTIDYQSSQTIGSLAINRIFLINKSMQKKQRESEIQRQRDLSSFEQTVRVTINMPRGVKSVQRLSPHQPIMDIFRKICLEKNLDASRYEVKLTKKPNITVDMSRSLNSYSANEITIVQCSVPDYHTSMVDISRASPSSLAYNSTAKMADPFEKVKKKKGLLSFFRKDKTKSAIEESGRDEVDIPKATKKVDEIRNPPVHGPPVQGPPVQGPPVNGDVTAPRKPQAQVKPQPKVQATIPEDAALDEVTRNKAKRAPSKKKYPAPAPPSRPLSTMGTISEEKKTTVQYTSTPNLASTPTISTSKVAGRSSKTLQHPGKSVENSTNAQRHSRNSSDSSGYHEPPTTPPESVSSPSTSDASTLPRPVKPPSNISPAIKKPRPASAIVQRSQTLPGAAVAKKPTKKKAAPPPPPTAQAPVVKAAAPSLTLHDKIIESEDETSSLNSTTDEAPEMGILSFNNKSAPIFVPPPPPQSPPPPALSESPNREAPVLSCESRSSVHTDPPFTQVTPHTRSDSRCSRASVDTIDDVQQYFDLAIAAGESQLRNEQGVVSPAAPQIDSPSTNEELAKLADELIGLTDNLDQEEAGKEVKEAEPTQDDVNAIVAHLNMSIGEDDGSDGSLVPDGENFVVAASKLPSGGNIDESIISTKNQSGYAKPVEEISYGDVIRFENPFRAALQTESVEDEQAPRLLRTDSQISDSTLPDSEHTDRPQSSSLQSSSLHSDEEESATETGDGYETASTEKVSHSETEAALKDVTDGRMSTATAKARKGTFQEVKGQDMNRAIYGDREKGSLRGIPGQDSGEVQVKTRAASFTTNNPAERVTVVPAVRKTEQARPKSVFAILSAQTATTADPPKAYPTSSTRSKESAASSASVSKDSTTTSALYSRPLPVYNRMNSGKTNSVTSPSSSQPIALASLIADSVKSGEATKSMRKAPETTSKPMFFKAARNSRVESPTTPDKIENVVKLDTSKYEIKNVAASQAKNNNISSQATPKKSPPPTAAKPTKPGATLTRKESLKEQYSKLQENMAKWQGKLKDNESRVKELTGSQQNLATAGLQLENKPAAAGMVKSASSSAALSARPFAANDDSPAESMPPELQKNRPDQVTLRSAANRVIQKAEPQLDPVESLMKSIRDRAGRISDTAPDRGIYVATGEKEAVPETIASREVAPTSTTAQPNVRNSTNKPNQGKLMNGVSRANDPRFNSAPSTRDSLLSEITNAAGRPTMSRPVADSSSSQSSSDELKEIQVRHKPQKTHKHKNSKRSISDPFPPQGPGSNGHIQDGENNAKTNVVNNRPSMTELDPREELMIAIRTSGGFGKLRQVNADEIKWSVQV